MVAHGGQVWRQAKCWECHGDTGKGDGQKAAGLKELPLKETTMRRRLVVTYRENGYQSAAAKRLHELLLQVGQTALREEKTPEHRG